jgi:hypothetical protein
MDLKNRKEWRGLDMFGSEYGQAQVDLCEIGNDH